jgi:hypothetical protein
MKLIFVVLFEQFECDDRTSMVVNITNITSPPSPDDSKCYYPQVLMTFIIDYLYE